MREKGFTLIEVLIALVIIAISLTAVVKATSSDIQNTTRITNIAMAEWVAQEAMNLLTMKIITPNNNETTQLTTLGERKWRWHAQFSPTKTKYLTQVRLSVYLGHSLLLEQDNYLLDNKK